MKESELMLIDISFLVLLVLMFIWMTVLSVKVYLRQQLFPIKERSPQITIVAILGFYLALVCKSFVKKDLIYENRTVQTLVSQVFDCIWLFGIINFTILQLFKLMRITITLKKHQIPPIILSIVKSEFNIILISTVSSCGMILLVKFVIGSYDQLQLALLSLNYLLGVYYLRDFKIEYGFQIEYLFLFISQEILNLGFFTNLALDEDSGSTLFLVTMWLQFVIYTIVSLFFPLQKAKSTVNPSLDSARSILGNFDLFLHQPLCVQIFNKYMKSIDKKSKQNGNMNRNEENKYNNWYFNQLLLEFYFDVKMELLQKNQQIDSNYAIETLSKYLGPDKYIYNKLHLLQNIPKIWEDRLKEYILDINSDAMRDKKKAIVILTCFYEFTEEYFQQVYYEKYSHTRSFKIIHDKLERNEMIIDNLSQLNMRSLSVV